MSARSRSHPWFGSRRDRWLDEIVGREREARNAFERETLPPENGVNYERVTWYIEFEPKDFEPHGMLRVKGMA